MPDRFHVKRATLVCAALLVAAGAATAPLYAGRGSDDNRGARALLRDASGLPVGVVRLSEDEGEVVVRASVQGLSPGFHGFHIHAVGACTPPFTSAGGHYNPGGTGHGAHAGDMLSLLVADDGTAQVRFTSDRFDVSELFDADGSAVIVHALPDNFANIPTRYHSHTENTLGPDSATLATGDSGGRVACGVVQ
ncbi:MAG: superoxide dismutase family protein [Gaiellaceae bacterium]